jgi:hypothetical protein
MFITLFPSNIDNLEIFMFKTLVLILDVLFKTLQLTLRICLTLPYDMQDFLAGGGKRQGKDEHHH